MRTLGNDEGEQIRSNLGLQIARSGSRLPNGHLTMHEIGELLRRAGRAADLAVTSEYHPWPGKRNKIDWVWWEDHTQSTAIAAFEVEGRDVQARSAVADRKKLGALAARKQFVILFQVDHDLQPKGGSEGGCVDRAIALLAEPSIQVLRDVDLWATGGIENLVASLM
jgi:hypothetical protein